MRATSVQVTGVAASAALPIDVYTIGDGATVQLEPGAGATVSVQGTVDDVFNPGVVPVWVDVPVAALIGATTNQSQVLTAPLKALRMNQTVGGSTSTMKVLQRGIV
jgi:hypothetical protein